MTTTFAGMQQCGPRSFVQSELFRAFSSQSSSFSPTGRALQSHLLSTYPYRCNTRLSIQVLSTRSPPSPPPFTATKGGEERTDEKVNNHGGEQFRRERRNRNDNGGEEEETAAAEDQVPLSYYLEVGDDAKESSRRLSKMLSMFDHGRWREHRSTARYLRHMAGILKSTTFRGLLGPLMSVSTVSTLVCAYETALKDGSLPASLPSLLLPPESFSLTSFALALLLVFRTNTSYDRWLEVNIMWWGLMDRSRDTLRQVTTAASNASMPPEVARWLMAYSLALKSELQASGSSHLGEELARVLTRDQLVEITKSHRPSSFALAVLSELFNSEDFSESRKERLDENLTYFEDVAGACSRILKVPIPVGYTRHTSRFMVIWLTALPLGFYGSCGWLTIPLCAVTAFLLLGIDEIGVQIEEPFALIPLNQICLDLERDLDSILDDSEDVKTMVQKSLAMGTLHK